MSSDDITLTLEKRETVGKGLNQLRSEGKMPAVIHNHGKDSVIVVGNQMEMAKVFARAGKHHPVNVQVGSDKYLTIIKSVDVEPKKYQLRHIVFGAIKQNEKVEAEVPVVIEGEIPAEKLGFMLITQLDHVTVEAFPKDLVDKLVIDGSKLAEVGDRVHVSDIQLPSGVTIKDDPEQGVAVIEESRAQAAAEPEEEAEGEAGADESKQAEEDE